MQPSLFDLPVEEPSGPASPPDQAVRDFAVDPSNHVVLEASAGTGKTRVLVDRFARLIEQGVDPRHILAVTFTRKAAAEMRDRVLKELQRRADTSQTFAARWRALESRVTDIQVMTIDAFCFTLLREFPLEANVDPAFEIADETEMARFANEALDITWRRVRGLIARDEHVRLLLTRVRLPQLRDVLSQCLDRRHIALPAVAGFVARQVRYESSADAAAAFVSRVSDRLRSSPHRGALLDDGPIHAAEFTWLKADLESLDAFEHGDTGRVQQLERRLGTYFLTDANKPRAQVARRFTREQFPSPEAKRRHEAAIKAIAPEIHAQLETLAWDVNGLLARGLQRVLAVAVRTYEQLLEEHSLLDFAAMLDKSVALLSKQEEFARSRLKLQSRYHHVLVDEFQDTSRLQWRLIDLLVDAWGEGDAVDAPTSIFIVGDRKQSIYRFRHAEVTLLDEAARRIAALRPGPWPRQAITHSFRAVPELLAFVNTLAESIRGDASLPEHFGYGEHDRFPVPAVQPGARRDGDPVVGLVAAASVEESAAAVAAEIVRLLQSATVRERQGPPRQIRPDDIAILFRARAGHQYFEDALDACGVRSYVYKGLGFFDAAEVQDLQALMRYLAQPESNLRAAEFLRSRFVRISDVGLARLAPSFAGALRAGDLAAAAPGVSALDAVDRTLLDRARTGVARWVELADRVTPSQVIDQVITDSAYMRELQGSRLDQARENVKKVRSLVRRVENRGYATVGRIASYFETLRTGEESNAIVAAKGCVNLMTIHAAKGLEFPVVFVVNMHAGAAGSPSISVIERGPDGEPHVAFGSTDGTRLEDRKEKEELRRLLYVAVTRARDRLYLAGLVDDRHQLVRGQRSLASLLPDTLTAVFGAASMSSDAAELSWGDFAVRVCRPAPDGPVRLPAEEAEPNPVDLPPLEPRTLAVTTATRATGMMSTSASAGAPVAPRATHPSHDRMAGVLVHRLLQRRIDPAIGPDAISSAAAKLVRPEELVDVDDSRALAATATALFLAVRAHPTVTRLLSNGDCRYEVPFSWRPDSGTGAALVRGFIDCLVFGPDGRLTVLEFKTGVPRPEHRAQAEQYLRAVRDVWPGRDVELEIIYP